ncbi:histidine phosphatase family protein [Candidatus Nephthysia bennettiae]|uniref:histidine phosphatase family protein n=1 Tax=Candidatus Nephthysia bennettiae TaxID=3127016 RepID=UPI003312FB3B
MVRHGATEWSKSGQHTSRTDLPLTPDGEEEARRLGRLLQSVRFAAVYTSDMQRARRTAELAGLKDLVVTPLLREFDYGEFEGLTTAGIRRSHPDWELFWDGCPGGETPDHVYARAQAFIELLRGKEGVVAAFSHGHFIRTLAVAWTELQVTAGARLGLDTASVSILIEGDRGRMIQRWNLVPEGSPAAVVTGPG